MPSVALSRRSRATILRTGCDASQGCVRMRANKILFRLFRNQEQRRFTIARESRFNELVAVIDPQFDAEGWLIEAGDTFRFVTLQDPHVAHMLERRLAFLWPSVGHARDRTRRDKANREGPCGAVCSTGTQPRSFAPLDRCVRACSEVNASGQKRNAAPRLKRKASASA